MSEPFDTAVRPPPVAPPAPAGGEDAAWVALLGRWQDEAAHQAYLARFTDLEGMGVAGRRYRAVLAERPEDAVAQRMCDAVLKKAMVLGLASLPRTAPVARDPWTRRLKLVAALVIGAFAVGVVAAIVRQLVQLLGPKP